MKTNTSYRILEPGELVLATDEIQSDGDAWAPVPTICIGTKVGYNPMVDTVRRAVKKYRLLERGEQIEVCDEVIIQETFIPAEPIHIGQKVGTPGCEMVRREVKEHELEIEDFKRLFKNPPIPRLNYISQLFDDLSNQAIKLFREREDRLTPEERATFVELWNRMAAPDGVKAKERERFTFYIPWDSWEGFGFDKPSSPSSPLSDLKLSASQYDERFMGADKVYEVELTIKGVV